MGAVKEDKDTADMLCSFSSALCTEDAERYLLFCGNKDTVLPGTGSTSLYTAALWDDDKFCAYLKKLQGISLNCLEETQSSKPSTLVIGRAD